MNGIIRVLIADELSVVRAGLRFAFSTDQHIKIVAEAGDGIEAEAKAFELKPDVIVTDILMPSRNGLELLKNIKERLPEVKVLLLTTSEEDDDFFRAIQLGADGYLSKKNDFPDIVAAIRKVVTHEPVLSSRMTARLITGFRKDKPEHLLSSREEQVLQLLREGLTTSEIACKLFLSPGTVSTYIHRILQKLGLKNRNEAVAYILNRRK